MKRMIMLTLAFAMASGGWLLSCDSSESLTTREQLRDEVSFSVRPDQSRVTMHVAFDRGDQWIGQPFAVEVLGGTITAALDADDAVTVTSMHIDLGDVVVPAGHSSVRGVTDEMLRFTGLALHLDRPTPCRDTSWSADDDACSAVLPAELNLEWAISVEGKTEPQATERLEQITLPVTVERRRGATTITVQAQVVDAMWDWAGMVEFGQLTMILRGSDRDPGVPDGDPDGPIFK